MRKIAVIFPGVGYTADRPLLYYAGKLAKAHGFEVVKVDFSGLEWSSGKLKDHGFLLQTLEKCLNITEKTLKEMGDMSDDEVVFISKSIGTVVAAAYSMRKGISARQISFSPLTLIESFVREESGIFFYGDNDPLADHKVIERIAEDKKLEIHRIGGGDHSLETGDIHGDIGNLSKIMSRVEDVVTNRNIYRMTVKNMDGTERKLADYRNKVLLIVNTATGCGFTPQYEALERFYRSYRSKGFEILDFPCNQFDREAPGSDAEIHSFCTARYDISFEQFAKIEVNGDNETGLYTYLKSRQCFHGFGNSPEAEYMRKKLSKEKPGYEETTDIKWNFTKFLISRRGEVVARFEPTEDMGIIEEAIRAELDRQ